MGGSLPEKKKGMVALVHRQDEGKKARCFTSHTAKKEGGERRKKL